MQKIDRLGWAAGFSGYAYGLCVGVRVNRADVLDRVKECLPVGWEPCNEPHVDYLVSFQVGGPSANPKVRKYHLVYGGLERLARTLDMDEALDELERGLHLHLADHARNRVFVHAGVVGWRGRAILIVGQSMSGKSTLVRELLQAGASYYSDEFAVLDLEGRVHPFPRRLSLRREEGLPALRCNAETFGSRNGEEPLPVGTVIFAKYRKGVTWQPKPMSPGHAVLELMKSTFCAVHTPEKALNALEQVVPQARALKGFRGEAAQVALAILKAG